MHVMALVAMTAYPVSVHSGHRGQVCVCVSVCERGKHHNSLWIFHVLTILSRIWGRKNSLSQEFKPLLSGDVWKNISDSDNSPLSWLQTSLLTAGKCYTSIFPSALIKIAKPGGFPTPAVQINTAATFWTFFVIYQRRTQNMQIVAPVSKKSEPV